MRGGEGRGPSLATLATPRTHRACNALARGHVPRACMWDSIYAMPYHEPDPDEPVYWRKPFDRYSIDDPPPASRPMSADRIRWLLFVIGWSTNELARRLDVDPKSARSWLAARRPIPLAIGDWLELLAAYHLAHMSPDMEKDFSPGAPSEGGKGTYFP